MVILYNQTHNMVFIIVYRYANWFYFVIIADHVTKYITSVVKVYQATWINFR